MGCASTQLTSKPKPGPGEGAVEQDIGGAVLGSEGPEREHRASTKSTTLQPHRVQSHSLDDFKHASQSILTCSNMTANKPLTNFPTSPSKLPMEIPDSQLFSFKRMTTNQPENTEEIGLKTIRGADGSMGDD
ncbi:unnamed protein product [Arctogadus glacialis]